MLYLCISLFATVIGSISGIGGGVIIKPVLDSLSPFGIATISFLSSCTILSMTTVTLFRSRNTEIMINRKIARVSWQEAASSEGMTGKIHI